MSIKNTRRVLTPKDPEAVPNIEEILAPLLAELSADLQQAFRRFYLEGQDAQTACGEAISRAEFSKARRTIRKQIANHLAIRPKSAGISVSGKRSSLRKSST